MVAERKVIDLEDIAGGDALADELERHPEGVVLRRGGRDFATVLSGTGSIDEAVGEADGRTVRWRDALEGLASDSSLAAIPVDGSVHDSITTRPMTPERLERILRIIGPRDDLAAADMHRRVEENRQASILRRTTARSDKTQG